MTFSVLELAEDAEILSLLLRDPAWTVYAISDVYPPYRSNATFFGAKQHGSVEAILLRYSLPGFTSLLPFGAAEGVEAILNELHSLPRTPFIICREDHLPSIRNRYRYDTPWRMSRMVLQAPSLPKAAPVGLPVVRLDVSQFHALDELYRSLEGRFFDKSMLEADPYFGIFDADLLVAAAGTHTFSPEHGLGTIGNVATLPAYRGRGYATALTHAVATALVAAGAGLLAPNVREDNVPAVRAYTRLGFEPYTHFYEGDGRLRDT